MTTEAARVPVDLLDADVTRAFHAWLATAGLTPAVHGVYLTAFRAGYLYGGASALRSSARLAELVPALRQLLALFEGAP